jgi:diaminopropionate ammonia-lyase
MNEIVELMNGLEVTDFFSNPRARRRPIYDLPAGLGLGPAREASRLISACPAHVPTPLISLDKAAEAAGLAAIYYKDEGARFGLKSFKSLGGAYAVGRLMQRLIVADSGQELEFGEIIRGAAKEFVAACCVATASAGNHGRAVAAGARLFGCRAVIFLSEGVSPDREQAVRDLGAEVIRVPGTYDDAVLAADETSQQKGWHLVSDASSPEYEEIPRDVMAGYGVIMNEIEAQLPEAGEPGLAALTHVFLQVGVGTFASALAAYLGQRLGADRPQIIVVEPSNASCLFAAVQAGQLQKVYGALETMMGGLACAEAASLAFEVLSELGDHYMTLEDQGVVPLMRALALEQLGPKVEAGESGVAGLMGLLALAGDRELGPLAGLDGQSKALVIGTEGASDAKIYRQLTGLAPRLEADPFKEMTDQ